MKHNWIARVICIILCLLMVLSALLPAFAAEDEETDEIVYSNMITIDSLEDFLTFAENCRLDSYSAGLAVTLTTDLDLSGTNFTGIPTFSGMFNGGGHTVSGLNLTNDGSVQGLFRYLTYTAIVTDLQVQGAVAPGGSRSTVGGIAGENRGTISGCSFKGNVSGGDIIGGLVGKNTVTGIMENCNISGSVYGNHFVGGIAGQNQGVIRSCENQAEVNTEAQQNEISLSDITIDSLTQSESANTVTDIGGIAGISSGVIRACENRGNVGYPHMGYNIGGIAGTQTGYIVDCVNYASIQGRKEVGGIVGQMEPTAKVAFSEDALQALSNQVSGMMGTMNQMMSGVNSMASQLDKMEQQANDAKESLDALKPDPENPEIPDQDSIQSAQNTLSSTLSGMAETMKSTASSMESTLSGMTKSMRSMSGQLNSMMATINNASENLGGTLVDISDADSEADLNGKVENCVNNGSVLADANVGGIAGAMAFESDLDSEEDIDLSGDSSLNFEGEIRAVVLNCENNGSVTGSKSYIGGIVGNQIMGLVKDCRSTATVDGAAADNVGGISGLSMGYIRSSSANCEIYGNTYVGGIAGSADMAADCHSMVLIHDASERSGAILGYAEDSNKELELPIYGNVYACIEQDIGGIDGISYAGIAEPMELDAFLAIESLHNMFRKVTLTFVYENGTQKTVSVTAGGKVSASQIPSIPEKSGAQGAWDGLEAADLNSVLYDMTFHAVYTNRNETISTTETRENGLPILLLQGVFPLDAEVSVTKSDAVPEVTEGNWVESWAVSCNDMENATSARLLLPEGMDAENAKLYLCHADGEWTESAFTADGSYLIFDLEGRSTTVALVEIPTDHSLLYIASGVAALGLFTLIILRKKKKPAQKEQA